MFGNSKHIFKFVVHRFPEKNGFKHRRESTTLLFYQAFINIYTSFEALEDRFQKNALKGQSREKVGEMSVWGISLGPN
jgi:hypothetical protein